MPLRLTAAVSVVDAKKKKKKKKKIIDSGDPKTYGSGLGHLMDL